MAYTQLFYHIVMRTYKSIDAIDEVYEKELYNCLYNFSEFKKCKVYRINGMSDHVHMFVSIHQSIAVSDYIHDIKIHASNFMKDNPHFPKWAGWGKSFCAITYSIRDKEMIINYIKNQKEHHKTVSTEDEIITLLRENGIDYDPKYL